jgi:hypothetical protein
MALQENSRSRTLLVNIDHIQRINELAGGAIGKTLLALLHVAGLLLNRFPARGRWPIRK